MAEPFSAGGIAQAHRGEGTVSVLTPRGRGAIAVIRVAADPAVLDSLPPLFLAVNGLPLAQQPINRLCFGRWGGDTGEDVVVCRIRPRITEITCHGGVAAVARIVEHLKQRGLCQISWTEDLGHSRSPIEAECLEALTRAETLRAASILLEQASGRLERALTAAADAPADELPFALDALLRWAEFGVRLTQRWKVVLTGLPNVGKSSLLNQLLGYSRSIVFSEPGTTRDVVTAVTALNGWPVELSDTAGLRDSAGPIETAGIERARQQLAAADLVVIVLDGSRAIADTEYDLVADHPDALLVAHKSDLPSVWGSAGPGDVVCVSSLTGAGVDELIGRIVQRLVPALPPAGTAIPVAARQVVALGAARAAAAKGNVLQARTILKQCLRGAIPADGATGQPLS